MSVKNCTKNVLSSRYLSPFNHIFPAIVFLTVMLFIFAMCNKSSIKSSSTPVGKWVGTWSTAPQLVEPRNNPPSPGLSNNTIRQVVHISIGGERLRVRFSNEFSKTPVQMKSVHIALSDGSDTIKQNTDKALTFDGEPAAIIEPGVTITSDPLNFTLEPLTNVSITIYFGETAPDVTGHPGSRTTSYLLTGNTVSAANFPNAVRTDHWYIINGIDVLAPETSAAVAVMGNSITDGRGSGTNKQNRWPDELARRLQDDPETKKVAVLNMGIGGNCVLRPCLGPSAIDRFDRDVLKQHGVRWLIILEGINDIGQTGPNNADEVAVNLIAAFDRMINDAHAGGILVYGATLLPFGDSFYDADYREAARQKVNEWIRNSGKFDAVIDLDTALRSQENPLRLLPEADCGDHLHPSERGHRMMAEAVNLSLFK